MGGKGVVAEEKHRLWVFWLAHFTASRCCETAPRASLHWRGSPRGSHSSVVPWASPSTRRVRRPCSCCTALKGRIPKEWEPGNGAVPQAPRVARPVSPRAARPKYSTWHGSGCIVQVQVLLRELTVYAEARVVSPSCVVIKVYCKHRCHKVKDVFVCS